MLLVLFSLEYFEPNQLTRPMELRVTTRNVEATQRILQRILARFKLGSEVREVRHEDEADPLGRIVYQVNVRANLSTDKLSDELFRADANDLDAVEWHQTKGNSYIYK